MSKGKGIFGFIAGLTAGAAAVFFSDEKNRAMAKKELTKVEKKAKVLKANYDKDPQKFKKELKDKAKSTIQKAGKSIKSQAKKLAQKKNTNKINKTKK